MSYLFDSDWLIDYLANRADATQLVRDLLPSGIAICTVTYMEVLQGIRGSRAPQVGSAAFARFLRASALIDFGQEHAERAADIRLDLRRRKRQVNERALDILIAATSIEHDLILVTRNIRDYEDIPGLRLYDVNEPD